ncbi:MAG: S-layer homology domain-containing protein [Syntrophomonas sp.]|nr:S-layer homology domain-containing protein [Syntrophomonas sp.]
MSCIKYALFTVAVMIFVITSLFGGGMSEGAAMPLNDLQGHWVRQAVSRAVALDLISGYPDGQFKPEQEISQIEALVLFMRAEGFNFDKAAAQKKTGKVPTQQVKNPQIPWGQSYLDAAAENQFLSAEEVANFNPQVSMTRAQIAALLTRMLQLPLVDQTVDASGSIAFSDLATTPSAYLPYVLSIADAGIMTGYQDGSFGPNMGLKRSEAAALLSKLMEQRWAKVPDDRRLVGWVKQLSQQKDSLEIELVSLQGTKKVKLDPNVQCFKGAQECLPRESIDYQVEVLLNSKKQAACISLLERRNMVATDEQIIGTVKSVAVGKDSLLVISDLDCQEKQLPLAWDAVMDGTIKGGNAKGFQSLKPLTFVKVFLKDGQVSRVTGLETKSISGTVKSLSGRRLDLDGKASKIGIPEWFNYWDRARVVDKEGKKSGNVTRGDKVKITYLDTIPGEIDDEIPLEIVVSSASTLKKVSGEVQTSGSSEQITLKKDKVYQIDSSATVYLSDGTQATFGTIRTTDKVEMQVDGAGVVMKITIVLKKISGEVQGKSGTEGHYQITLKTDKVYAFDSTAIIYQADNTTTTFDHIQIADQVDIEVDGAGVAMKVTIAEDSNP